MSFFKKKLINILRRDEFGSDLLRDLFRKWYGVTVGKYSYGCFDSLRIPRNTIIGRYCSFSTTCYIFARDHGVDFLSLSPYFYNSKLGLIDEDKISNNSCVVEDDVWVGHNAVITSNVKKIGRGSIIAAGAVVTQDVPPYAIVAGVPAKLIRYRFDRAVINKIEETKWWELSKDNVSKLIKENPRLVYSPACYFSDQQHL